jgi:hypothetical protein
LFVVLLVILNEQEVLSNGYMSGLERVHLRLTPDQMRKLHAGKNVQLGQAQLGVEDAHHVMVHPHVAAKIHRAHRAKKGVRIRMEPHEIEETIGGGGFGDFFNKLKDAGNWLKKNIVDSSFYQSNIKPLARSAVDTGLAALAPRLGVAAPVAKAAVDEIGKHTNAFGLPKGKGAVHLTRSKEIVVAKPVVTKKKHMARHTVQRAPVDADALRAFYEESMMMPRPGGPAGFTCLPQGEYGSGLYGAGNIHHHHYYPFQHHREMHGNSFRLA